MRRGAGLSVVIPGCARLAQASPSSFRDAPFGAGPKSITTKFAWGDVYPVVFKIGNGGYGFRARAKKAARPGMTALRCSFAFPQRRPLRRHSGMRHLHY
jgi:hypothetical protein